MTHRTDRADASVVAFHRTMLDRSLRGIARAYELHAWAVVDGDNELVGPLFVVKCDLCPVTRKDTEADPIVTWWRDHWEDHHVNGKRDG